ncbi:MAG TPA: alpha/beta hydrolase-fold protein [Mycobacterium sp.]
MGLTINGWLGYFPTVATAVNQLTGGPLPDQTDMATVRAMQSRGAQPVTGALVPVDIDSAASGFRHRPEWVYLPPAWFTAKPASRLPTLMMIGAEFNTPADWVRAGDAVHTLDVFAAGHNGEAPVAVFVDPTGAFNNDTECVNGPRGNAADHLTKDVVPYTVATFGLSGDRSRWGVVGFTSGGTCAVDLAVMHSDMLSAFVDIAGDRGPHAGTKAQTVDRLYGGDAEAWSAFDPTTVITRHGPYADLSGVFAVPAAVGARSAGNAYDARSRGQADAAETQCALGRSKAISCSVQSYPGGHTWPFAATAFRAALPWLADRLGRPDVAP